MCISLGNITALWAGVKIITYKDQQFNICTPFKIKNF